MNSERPSDELLDHDDALAGNVASGSESVLDRPSGHAGSRIGSTFDSWLESEGILEDVTRVAIERVFVSYGPLCQWCSRPMAGRVQCCDMLRRGAYE